MTEEEQVLKKQKYIRDRDSSIQLKTFLKNKLLQDDEHSTLVPQLQRNKPWTTEEDNIIIKQYQQNTLKSWKYVATFFPDRTRV